MPCILCGNHATNFNNLQNTLQMTDITQDAIFRKELCLENG